MKSVRWSSLRTIGNSLPAKVTVLVPFVGNLIIFSSFMRQLTSGGYGLAYIPGDALLGSIDYFLYIYYIGLILFGIGTILYSLFCDSIVKECMTEDEYVARYLDFSIRNDIIEMSEYVNHRYTENKVYLDSMGFFAAKRVVEEQTDASGLPRATIIFLMKAFYRSKDLDHKFVRMAVLALYFSGSCFLFYPSIKTVVHVLVIVVAHTGT